jgi:Histidine kinase
MSPADPQQASPRAAALAHRLVPRVPAATEPAGLSFRQLLAVASVYWLYVTVSDILYANSLRVGFSQITSAQLFVPWDIRLLQHLILFPALIGCLWLSLRWGWRPLWRALPVQLPLAALFSVAAAPALWLGEALIPLNLEHHSKDMMKDDSFITQGDLALWLASATLFCFAYAFALVAINGFAWYRRYRDAELQVTALQANWSAARLAALRMQLSPHTLFNLLNTIHGQIGWDPGLAQSMVIQLADLLRRLLNAGEREFVRLSEELHFVRLYLELQMRRFPDRLGITLPDGNDMPALWVPSLILQPLVENAVVHGLAGHEGPVQIAITARVEAGTLVVRIANTVSPARVVSRAGIGLTNVRERLQVQFGARASLETSLDPATGWVAEVRMPALPDPPPARPEAQDSGAAA